MAASLLDIGYCGIGSREEKDRRGRNLAGECNVDVICSDGDKWRKEIPVIVVYSQSGFLICTGSMVNSVDSNGDHTGSQSLWCDLG